MNDLPPNLSLELLKWMPDLVDVAENLMTGSRNARAAALNL
jgi:hypothetical protein